MTCPRCIGGRMMAQNDVLGGPYAECLACCHIIWATPPDLTPPTSIGYRRDMVIDRWSKNRAQAMAAERRRQSRARTLQLHMERTR